jgi:hypothetical protein
MVGHSESGVSCSGATSVIGTVAIPLLSLWAQIAGAEARNSMWLPFASTRFAKRLLKDRRFHPGRFTATNVPERFLISYD